MFRRIIVVCLILMVSAVCAAEKQLEYRYTVAVSAVSKGVAKDIYSTVDSKKCKNMLTLAVCVKKNGEVHISSDKFKLGKMPFSSYFTFVIPPTEAVKNADGMYESENLTGYYKVLGIKSTAHLSGSFNESACTLVVKVTRKKKSIVLSLKSIAADSAVAIDRYEK